MIGQFYGPTPFAARFPALPQAACSLSKSCRALTCYSTGKLPDTRSTEALPKPSATTASSSSKSSRACQITSPGPGTPVPREGLGLLVQKLKFLYPIGRRNPLVVVRDVPAGLVVTPCRDFIHPDLADLLGELGEVHLRCGLALSGGCRSQPGPWPSRWPPGVWPFHIRYAHVDGGLERNVVLVHGDCLLGICSCR